MKIVIVDGVHKADYIISLYKSRTNNLIVINSDKDICSYLNRNNNVPVVYANPTKETSLREAGIEDADLFIALGEDDVKNYISCKMAKLLFNVKKCIATVTNPKNVEVFKKLGIDSVISSTYLLGHQIKNAASVENLINTLTIEDEKVQIMEFKISANKDVVGKKLSEINASEYGSVSSIIRGAQMIIPNGSTEIKQDDRVLVVTSEEKKDKIVEIFTR